jgi:hypothetical protein
VCRAPQRLFQLCVAASAFSAIPGVAASAASSATRGTAASAPSATRGIAASRSSATDASETCGGAGHCRASHTRSRTSGTRGGYFRLRCRRGPRLGIGLRCSPPTLPSPAPLAAPTGGVRRDDDRSEAIEHAPDLRRAPGAAARSRDALLFKPAAMPVRLVTPAACSSAMIGSPVSHWRPPCAMPPTFSSSTRRQGR